MADKDRERFYLARLRDCFYGIPEGQPIEPEPPDFVFGDHHLGIEFTEFYLPPDSGNRPQQEISSLRDQIMEQAERLHHASGGPALYVSAVFNDHCPLRKRDLPRLAQIVSNAVLSTSVPASVYVGSVAVERSRLPSEIPHIDIYSSVDGVDRLWQGGSGSRVDAIQPKHVQTEIDRKAQKAGLARKRCRELWLVIVHDLFRGGTPACITEAAINHLYQHNFNKVIWFEPHVPRAWTLQHFISGG